MWTVSMEILHAFVDISMLRKILNNKAKGPLISLKLMHAIISLKEFSKIIAKCTFSYISSTEICNIVTKEGQFC